MKIFSALYDRVLTWSGHPHAERYLAGLSFAESSFFPIPPDVMLAPMTLAKPAHGWRFALVTTVASVAGGLAGYAIGYGGAAALRLPEDMRRALTMEIGMQNAGLGVALALKHFAPETALPGALSAFWCILTAAGASSWLRRRDAEPVPGT